VNKPPSETVETPIAPWDEDSDPCLCGVSNCRGHEMIGGEIHIPNHPTLGYVILTRNPLPKAAA
jgi:hypothetical protein